jgi:hypothetical protein
MVFLDTEAVKDIIERFGRSVVKANTVGVCAGTVLCFIFGKQIGDGCFDVGFGIGFHDMYLISSGFQDIAGRSERMTQSAGERKIMTRWTWNHHKPCPVVGRTGKKGRDQNARQYPGAVMTD